MNIDKFDHLNKIFCKSNWSYTKKLIMDDVINDVSPILTLDLTNNCNFKCGYCIDSELVSTSKSKEIEWELLKNLLIDLRQKGCGYLEVSGGGEPTLYSKFGEFLELTSKLKFKLGLMTNGSMLDKFKSNIEKSPFDWIRVSLDAANEMSHSNIHGVKNYFYKILDSIKFLSSKLNVGISFLINELNVDEMYDAAKIAKEYNTKYIEFKPLTFNYKCSEFIDAKYKNKIESYLYKIESLRSAEFQIFYSASLKNWLNNNYNFSNNYDKCFAACYRSVLTPTGMYACPYHRGMNSTGNIPQNAKELIDMRNDSLEKIKPSIDCQFFCIRSNINKAINNIKRASANNLEILNYIGWPFDYGDDIKWI